MFRLGSLDEQAPSAPNSTKQVRYRSTPVVLSNAGVFPHRSLNAAQPITTMRTKALPYGMSLGGLSGDAREAALSQRPRRGRAMKSVLRYV